MFRFWTDLLESNGELVVPQLQVLPMPERNTAADFSLLQRGAAPAVPRCGLSGSFLAP